MKSSNSQRLSPNDSLAQDAFAQALETLNRLSEERVKMREVENSKTSKAIEALQAPFLKQIQENPAAAHALEKLRDHRVPETADFLPHVPVRDGRSGGPFLNLHLQEHVSIIGAPYDFEWQWGNPVSGSGRHNRLNGEIGIHGASGHTKNGASGRVEAASGIGLVLTTNRPAIVSVRPYISYIWESVVGTAGLFSSAETRGGIDATAFLDGALIDGVRRSELFSDSKSSFGGTSHNNGNGVVWVPDVTLGFNMEPGQNVVVNFGAYVECDHSNGIGVGAGSGLVQAQVSWIVVERFIGG
jgi:hypothetical protein